MSGNGLRICVVSLIAGLVLALPARAQAEEEAWYHFGLVLFAYNNPSYTESELWPNSPGNPPFDKAYTVLPDAPGAESKPASFGTAIAPAVPVVQVAAPPGFRLLEEAEPRLLEREAALIGKSRDRKLLLHMGWIQNVQAREKAVPMRIHAGDRFRAIIINRDFQSPAQPGLPANGSMTTDVPGVEQAADSSGAVTPYSTPTEPAPEVYTLDGNITLSISRYLHVYTDLIYHRRVETPLQISDPLAGVGVKKFRFADHRRMRSKELHYIDNPVFGILITAVPYEPAKATTGPGGKSPL